MKVKKSYPNVYYQKISSGKKCLHETCARSPCPRVIRIVYISIGTYLPVQA